MRFLLDDIRFELTYFDLVSATNTNSASSWRAERSQIVQQWNQLQFLPQIIAIIYFD